MIFKAFATGGYRHVFQFNEEGVDDLNLISIDTGASGNIFYGDYFAANARHRAGKLQRVETDFTKLEANDKGPTKNFVLSINPKKE